MAVEYKGDNYTGQYVTVPNVKWPKGEIAGKMRTAIERKTLVDAAGTAAMDSGDTILGPIIPANSIIVDAYYRINKSLGATGIIDLGHEATTLESDGSAIALDQDGLVLGVNGGGAGDGGGQAFLSRCKAEATILNKRLGSDCQIYATFTEVMDNSVLDAVLEIVVIYVNT